MMDIKYQHHYNSLDYSDKQVTLCNGKTVSLSKYRREIEESSNNKQQDQPCSSDQSSSQENNGETRLIKVEITLPNGDQRSVTCRVTRGPIREIISEILQKLDVPIVAGRYAKYKETGPNSYLIKFVPEEFTFAMPQPVATWPRNMKIAPGFTVCPNCGVCTIADLQRCVRCRLLFDASKDYYPFN